jgi:hypothetical protein
MLFLPHMSRYFLLVLEWYGACAILAAFALLNFGVLDVRTWLYTLLNITGACAVAIGAWHKKDYPPALLNLVWFAVALWGVLVSRVTR